MSFKIGVLKSFTTFKQNTCVGVLFNKVPGLRLATSLKKTPTQVFSCEYCETFKNNVFIEHHW